MCSLIFYAQLVPGLLNFALHANYFSTPQQFTQGIVRMDSGTANTCIEHA